MGNIERFSLNVTKIVAALYDQHPRPIMLSFQTIGADKDDSDAVADVSGAIEWLHRNHLISGDITRMGGGMIVVSNALLTASGYRVLSKPERNANGVPLGQFAAALAKEGTAVAPDLTGLVVERLLSS